MNREQWTDDGPIEKTFAEKVHVSFLPRRVSRSVDHEPGTPASSEELLFEGPLKGFVAYLELDG